MAGKQYMTAGFCGNRHTHTIRKEMLEMVFSTLRLYSEHDLGNSDPHVEAGSNISTIAL
jgi:hypothetical protein